MSVASIKTEGSVRFPPIAAIRTGWHFQTMSIVGLAVGTFGLFVVGRMIVLGGASADGQGFRRDEQPAIYWTIVAIGCAIVCGLFYIAIVDPFGPRP